MKPVSLPMGHLLRARLPAGTGIDDLVAARGTPSTRL